MIERLSRRKRNLVLALLGVLFVWFAWSIRSVVNPLLIGYLLAFILHPLVERVQQLGFSRRSAVNLVFLGGFLLGTVISVGLVLQGKALVSELIEGPPTTVAAEARPTLDPGGLAALESTTSGPPEGPSTGAQGAGGGEGLVPVVREGDRFVQQEGSSPEQHGAVLERWLSNLQLQLNFFIERANGWFGTDFAPMQLKIEDVKRLTNDWIDSHKEEGLGLGMWLASRSLGLTLDFAGGLFALAGLLFLVPLYCYYLLFELERLHRFIIRYIPKADRQRLSGVGREIGEVIAAFFRGRLSVCLIKGIFLSIGLWIAGVDYALLFGIVSGFLSLIPFVGAALGFLMAFVFAIVGHGVLDALIRTGIVFFAAEMFEGYFLMPRILGDSLGLHPLVVIFAIFVGGAALGTLGVVLALPLTAALVILVRELVLPAMQRMADDDYGPPPEPPEPPDAPTPEAKTAPKRRSPKSEKANKTKRNKK